MMRALNSARSIVTVTAFLGTKSQNLIRTFQITGVGALALAVFVLISTARGVHDDERVEKLLSSPGIVERFKATERDLAQTANDQTAPLVKQAEAFAIHLSPKSKARKPAPQHKIKIAQSRIQPIKPDLKVLGTSFCRGNPEISLALIDEPGKERRWFRQSSRVGGFLIERIRDGFVIVKKDEKAYQLMLEQGSERSHKKEMAPISTKALDQTHEGYSLLIPSKDSSIAPKTAGDVPAPTKYDILQPMWGEDGLSAQVLSYASSPK